MPKPPESHQADAMPKPESLQKDLHKHEQDTAKQDTGIQNHPQDFPVQVGNCKRTLFQVHDIVPLHIRAPYDYAPYDYAHHGTISFIQMNRVLQWGQCLFMKRFWLSKMIHDFGTKKTKETIDNEKTTWLVIMAMVLVEQERFIMILTIIMWVMTWK